MSGSDDGDVVTVGMIADASMVSAAVGMAVTATAFVVVATMTVFVAMTPSPLAMMVTAGAMMSSYGMLVPSMITISVASVIVGDPVIYTSRTATPWRRCWPPLSTLSTAAPVRDAENGPLPAVRRTLEYVTTHAARLDYPAFVLLAMRAGSGRSTSTSHQQRLRCYPRPLSFGARRRQPRPGLRRGSAHDGAPWGGAARLNATRGRCQPTGVGARASLVDSTSGDRYTSSSPATSTPASC